MVFFFFCILLLASGYWLWHLAGRSPSRRYGWNAVWRVAALIGVVRIGALWLGVASFRYPDWRQVVGYFLQMLALPEIYLARGTRADPLTWAIVVTILLAATSWLSAALLIWVANRLRPTQGDSR